MKYLLVLLMAISGTWGFAQEGTTEEEYKYLTKGYAYQSEMGLDHKKEGYLIQEIYEAENKVRFIGMFHSFSGKTKAYLAIIPQEEEQAAIHLCIPNNAATETIRRRYLEDKRELLNTIPLQDQFDEAWRAFFYHQSSTSLNWMQRPKTTAQPMVMPPPPAKPPTKQLQEHKSAPLQPEITSKGIPVRVREYDVVSGMEQGTDQASEIPVSKQPEQQILVYGEVEGELSGRELVKIPVIKQSFTSTGTVVIKICVDASGNVNYAKYTQRGSTTFNGQLKRLALDSALDAQFKPENDNEEQCGYISFEFQ